jgi:hypothetical protein
MCVQVPYVQYEYGNQILFENPEKEARHTTPLTHKKKRFGVCCFGFFRSMNDLLH